MRVATVEQTGIGQSNPCPVDFVQVPTNLSLFAKNTSGYAAYTIQYTEDDIYEIDFNGNPLYDPNTGTWFDVPELVNKSGPNSAGFNRPATAFRINNLNGDGTTELQIRQGLGQ